MGVLQAVSSGFNYQNIAMEWDHPAYPGILRGTETHIALGCLGRIRHGTPRIAG